MIKHSKDDKKGLTAKQVLRRIERGQTNAFVQKTSRSVWSIIRGNTFTLFNGIIAVCFVILISIGRWQDVFFALAAFANAIIGSIQEFRAKRALDALALLDAHHTVVIRDGHEQAITTAEIVLGDLLVLRAGDQIPADAKVSDSFGLQLDQSMLTGESDPVDKKQGSEVLSGSVVVAGTGYAVVDKVGADSFANRFASDARRFSLVASELRNSINKVLKVVTWIIGPVIILILNSQVIVLGGWAHIANPDVWQVAVVSTIASIVSMIPLGLVLITSVSFALGAVKLSRQKVLVKELAAVEGLARVDMICLDKTGTLTEGSISFQDEYSLSKKSFSGWKNVLAWYAVQPGSNATARSLATGYRDVPAQSISGQILFSSARKWSAVSFESGKLKGSWVLGGPEMVFPNGDASLNGKSLELAQTGLRTLVLAYSDEPLDVANEVLPEKLQPVTLLSFQETIRPDAAETLRYFKAQGVAVRIISGDNPDTVAAIARRVGLDAPVGFDARKLPSEESALVKVLENNIVFGRVTPEQKQRMVIALQTMGHTVAMTGDGVNDTLAIKQADIGIAMNSGSAAAKAVARLVLLDGQFSHLPGVVEEGRQVIANIERVSMLFLSKTTYAFGLAILFGIMVLPFPFLPRQESIVDGLTIGLPAFFLALMPNKQRYRPGFLKRSLTFSIPTGIIIASSVAVYARLATDMGIDQEMLRTGATMLLIIMGLWVLVVLSRPVNILKTLIIGAMMIGLVLVFSVPFVTEFLQFVDVNAAVAGLIVGLSLGAIVLIEIVRFIHTRLFEKKTKMLPRPAELTIVVALTYISAYAMIVVGLLAIFTRYLPDISSYDRSIMTIVGTSVIFLSFLTISVASGIARGDRISRIVLTIIFSVVAALSLFGAISAREVEEELILVIFTLGMIAVLWTGRRRSYFQRSQTR